MDLQQFMMLTNTSINQSFKYKHLRLLLYLEEMTHLNKLYSTFIFNDCCKNIELAFFSNYEKSKVAFTYKISSYLNMCVCTPACAYLNYFKFCKVNTTFDFS